MKTIKVRIPAIVTADGKWAAGGSNNEPPDWDFLDETCDYEKPPICPKRMFITVDLPVPDKTAEVEATSVELENTP